MLIEGEWRGRWIGAEPSDDKRGKRWWVQREGGGESIDDNIVFASGVANVGGEFGDVGKLALLAGGPGRGDAVKGSNERLEVSEDAETVVVIGFVTRSREGRGSDEMRRGA